MHMNDSVVLKWSFIFSLISGVFSIHFHAAQAVEPSKEFVAGLQDRKFYDTALEYLGDAPNNPLVSEKFKKNVTYEKAAMHIHWARNTRDHEIANQRLEQGVTLLETFLREQPRHPRVPYAQMQLGHVEIHRARLLVIQANQPNAPAEKERLLKQAREHFKKAYQRYSSAEKRFRHNRNKYPAFSMGLLLEGDRAKRRASV